MTEDVEPWIALEWEAPVRLNRVQLTFDTMVREQRFFDRPVLGPLPTCVRDCAVEFRDLQGRWRPVARLEGNFMRHRIVSFKALRTDAVRIRVEKTHGDPHARLYEIRIYQEC